MRGAIVALDIETTGLDQQRDQIIEIGALRSENGVETAAFQTFVNPGVPIPPFITELTGISDDQVADAPLAAAALTSFADFVGESPVLAHNASFDLGFLRAGGILRANQVLDSVELATILLPQAPRYSLGALAEQLGITLVNAHRALADARATSELYWQLWQRALALPEATLAAICQDARGLNWRPAPFFQAVLAAVAAGGAPLIPQQPAVEPHPKQLIADGNPAIQEALREALQAREHLLLETGAQREAPAASVIAAAAWVKERGERVTLVANEEGSLVALRSAARHLAAEQGLRWAEWSAPADILCRRAWDAQRTLAPQDGEELQFRAKVFVWLTQGGSGQRRQMRLRGPRERALWRRVSAEHCPCSNAADCPWQRAQEAIASAAVIIVSQADWWSARNEQEPGLPAQGPLIIHDAAQWEEVLSDASAFRMEKEALSRVIQTMTAAKGGLLSELVGAGLNEEFLQNLKRSLLSLGVSWEELFAALPALWGAGEERWLRLTAVQRRRSAYALVVTAARRFCELGDEVVAALDRLATGLAARETSAAHSLLIRGLLSEIQRALTGIRQGILEDREELERWLERNRWAGGLLYSLAPLRPGKAFSERMAAWPGALILQDCAISTGDEGDFWRERFSWPGLTWRSLPEDSEDEEGVSTLYYIPHDVPPPNERAGYQRTLERCLLNLVSEVDGRTLALFTSYAHLRDTANALRARLRLGGIPVFEGNPTPAVWAADCGLLLMNWRDLQGQLLPAGSISCALLARLPFDLPNLPLVAGRSASYEDGFGDFSVPVASQRQLMMLRRVQMAAGERCAFVVADSRIVSKRYGERFLDALPALELRYGESSSLGRAVARWIKEGI